MGLTATATSTLKSIIRIFMDTASSTTFTEQVVDMSQNLDTSEISNWRSLVTSIVFVLTSK